MSFMRTYDTRAVKHARRAIVLSHIPTWRRTRKDEIQRTSRSHSSSVFLIFTHKYDELFDLTPTNFFFFFFLSSGGWGKIKL